MFKFLLSIAWSSGFAIAALGYLFSQSVATGGWVEQFAARFGARAEALAAAVGGFVVLYPDICIHGVFTVIFWLHSFLGLWLSLVALTMLIPQLITRDRASNALTVYLARPLTSTDYLLGKLGIIAGVMVLLWTGPLVAGWFVGMLFSPDRDFIIYSFGPLVRALAFHGIALASISAIALGVSSIGRTARVTTTIWLALWLIFGAAAMPPPAPDWIKRASFSYDLAQARQHVFKLDEALRAAGSKLPLINPRMASSLTDAGAKAKARDFNGALAALAALIALSCFVFFRKLKPE